MAGRLDIVAFCVKWRRLLVCRVRVIICCFRWTVIGEKMAGIMNNETGLDQLAKVLKNKNNPPNKPPTNTADYTSHQPENQPKKEGFQISAGTAFKFGLCAGAGWWIACFILSVITFFLFGAIMISAIAKGGGKTGTPPTPAKIITPIKPQITMPQVQPKSQREASKINKSTTPPATYPVRGAEPIPKQTRFPGSRE